MPGRRAASPRRLLLAATVTLGALSVPQAGAAFKYLHEGMKAPQVSGVDLASGTEISLEKLNEGSIVVIVFWATWSERSLEQLQALGEMAKTYAGKPVRFVAVNVDADEISAAAEQQIKRVVAEMQLPFPVIIDRGLKNFYEYGVIAVPSTAILDTAGILRHGPAGYSLTTRDLIVDSVEVLLGLRAPSAITVTDRGYRPDKVASRYYYLAAGLTRQRLYEQAWEHIDHAIRIDSLFPAPYCLRGEVLLKLDSVEAALISYRRAVTLDSASVQARSGLGEALLRAEKTDSALQVLQFAYTMDSTFTPAVVQLSICLFRLNRLDEAVQRLQQARSMNPRDPLILYHLGYIARKSGDTAQAIESYRQALELLYPAP
ncbi:MAG TPA: tetratricopeptide repeat protein [Candidatus Deferrimicrobium sp.]|nr:tetratricopeptide repeat protein [Candidatus Deferrimicrobium sp.]